MTIKAHKIMIMTIQIIVTMLIKRMIKIMTILKELYRKNERGYRMKPDETNGTDSAVYWSDGDT